MSHSLCWMPHYSHFYYTACFRNAPAGMLINRMCIGESVQFINYHHTSYAFHMSLKSCPKIYQIVWIYAEERVKKCVLHLGRSNHYSMYTDVRIVYLGTSNALLYITDPELFHLYYVYLYNDTFLSQEYYVSPTDRKGCGRKRLRFIAAGLKPALDAGRSQAWHFPLAGKSLSKA